MGIVSWSTKTCGTATEPDVDSRVDAVLDWIQAAIAEVEAASEGVNAAGSLPASSRSPAPAPAGEQRRAPSTSPVLALRPCSPAAVGEQHPAPGNSPVLAPGPRSPAPAGEQQPAPSNSSAVAAPGGGVVMRAEQPPLSKRHGIDG